MSILVGNPFFLDAGTGATGYQISRSLRFNSSDSAFCSRTFSSTGNRTSWTWSGWVKRSNLVSSSRQVLFGGYGANNDTDWLEFGFGYSNEPNDTFYWTTSSSSSSSTAVFRDLSAWYHVLVSYNGSNIVAYVNNTTILTSSKTGNLGVNGAWLHTLGRSPNSGIRYFDGYLADVYFIDGQTLTPSSFVETSATTGQLIPKAYTGSFGTNGFWLKFSDNSAATATTLGKDYSGNGNNWTPNNLSVTAGAGNDSLTDTPTSYGTDTGAGGEVRGNYCTWNPVGVSNQGSVAWTLSDGNLVASDAASNIYGTVPGTMAVSSGKWYWEVTVSLGLSGIDPYQGIGVESASLTDARNPWTATKACYYLGDGYKAVDAVRTAYGTAWSLNDVIGVALDMDANTVTFYRNNTSQGSISISPNGAAYRPAVGDYNNGKGSIYTANFGQRPFAYTAPSGFKALCDTNLPAPTIALPSTMMDVKLYTGNGTSQTISGLGFSPDFVWLKSRGAAYNHQLFDTIRGTGKQLFSNLTSAETTESFSWLNAFNSNGFGVTGAAGVNDTNDPMVAWCFDAGSSTSTNTAGSITSSCRTNQSSGFSIVSYTVAYTGSARTVGHGLGVKPSLIILKNRSDGSANWRIYHSASGASLPLILNSTAAAASNFGIWNDTEPTSSVFTVGINTDVGGNIGSGDNLIAYCFSPVAGYSSFGSYTGNNNADGPFIYTGFRPRWILIKPNYSTYPWEIYDTARSAFNVVNVTLAPNTSNSEPGQPFPGLIDVTSNGFKIRSTFANSYINTSGVDHLYVAFAESPFQYARAR